MDKSIFGAEEFSITGKREKINIVSRNLILNHRNVGELMQESW